MSERKDNINEFDLMMKSILDEGREEVPAHIWEGVSDGLDKAAHRKTVVLWWRRAAAGVAAAAAVAFAVVFSHDEPDTLVPDAVDKDMIATVRPVEEADPVPVPETEAFMASAGNMIAMAEPVDIAGPATQEITENKDVAVIENTTEDITEAVEKKDEAVEVRQKTENEESIYHPIDWGEDTEERKHRNISLMVSGVAGTNNTEGQNRIGPMKRPSVNPAPVKTGIEETSTKGSYGIPVSFGAGVKVDLNSRWSIGAGLNYTLMSRQFYGKYIRIGESGSIENSTSSDIRNVQHYVGIPVNAFYNIISNEGINLYAYAGGAVEKCISDKYSVLSTSITHKEKAKGVQLSANAGIGVEFMLGDNLGLYIDPSLRYYFNNGQPKSIRTMQPLMLGFEMGFRARL